MNAVENPHAGQGSSVLLDIGGEVGALVVTTPPGLEDQEIELRPARRTTHAHLPHVAVVPRPAADGTILHSAVFGGVPEDTYELYVRPDGPVRLTVDVHAGQVTEATWPH